MMKEYSANCSCCGEELAKLQAVSEKEFISSNLIPQLQRCITNGNKSLLIDCLKSSSGTTNRRSNNRAFIIPSNQVSIAPRLMSQEKGFTC